MLRAMGHASVSFALSVVAIDRLLDLAVVLLIFAWAIIAVPEFPPAAASAAGILMAVCAGAFIVILIASRYKRQLLTLVESLLTRWIGTQGPRWFRRVETVLDGLGVFNEPRRIGVALVVSFATWALAAFASWLILLAIWPKAPFAAVALGICLAAIDNALVSVPVGIGVVHAANVLATVMFGASQEVGLAFAVTGHAVTTAVTAFVGIACLPITRRLGLKGLLRVPEKN